MKAQTGDQAPELSISEWVQGESVQLSQLLGKVVLLDFFQVNCPGCFLYALPHAISLHERFADKGLVVLGIATAFEDFDKNTLENLKRLINQHELTGATLELLSQRGELVNGRWPYQIPFPVAMDRLVKRSEPVNDGVIDSFISERVPDFSEQTFEHQENIRAHVKNYFQSLQFHAETFDRFDLKGTPSQVLIDQQGIIREIAFGTSPDLEDQIAGLFLEEAD
ncbi:redoxin domain-containing protein [Methylicorpusculum oleiharenae]|uniref:peroxiredoxin family protein n=1 Tax=Methylicorpusculum oleiharenae TaxID=1338687 RepID=UPI001359E62C|nr:redoxin domain-containing protein [Methylicorpusculum oleiharenae]MCD2451541.1 redoxin domain-containing protein [Methylicorpusculum oleiharenae]